jgi:hypothetical protein
MSDTLKKREFQRLLDETVSALQETLEKAEKEISVEGQETLAKADEGKETPAEKKPSGDSAKGSEPDKKPDAPAEASKEGSNEPPKEGPGNKESSPPAEASASGDSAPGEGGEVPPGGEGAPADPAQEPGENVSVESLQAEYATMPIEQQKMHLLALKAALMSTVSAQDAQMAAQAAPMGAPGAAPAAPIAAPVAPPTPPVAPPADPAMPPVQKSEASAEILSRLETLEKSLKEKDSIIEGFGKAVEGLKGSIISNRKSLATVVGLAKSEPAPEAVVLNMSKDQVASKLKEITSAGKLSKSDKDLVLSFVAGGNKDVSRIAHLLK